MENTNFVARKKKSVIVCFLLKSGDTRANIAFGQFFKNPFYLVKIIKIWATFFFKTGQKCCLDME